MAMLVAVACAPGHVVGAKSTPDHACSSSVEFLKRRALSALESLDALSFTVLVASPDGKGVRVELSVLMARAGRFRVCARAGPAPGVGILSDGREWTEWSGASKAWTRYPAPDPTAEFEFRLLGNEPNFPARAWNAIRTHARSWIARPSPFAARFEQMQTAGELKLVAEMADGRRCDGVEVRAGASGAELLLTQIGRLYFDAETALPTRAEYLVQPNLPFVSIASESTSVTTYESVVRDPQIDDGTFAFVPSPGFTYVEPRVRRPADEHLVGTRFPDGELKTIADETIAIRRERRSLPTVIVVWATYCNSCKVELRELPELLKREKLEDVRVVAVSVDRDAGVLKRSLLRAPLSCPVVHDPRFVERLGLGEGIPRTLVLDGDGMIRAIVVAWGGDAARNELADAIRAAHGR